MNFVRIVTFTLAMLMTGIIAGAASPGQKSGGVATADFVDINHATLAELRALPGVGEAYSLAIVKHRPYKNKTQLRSKGVIPLAAYKKIKDKIIAKQ